MDEKKLILMAEKFVAIGKEFLELIRDLDLEYDDEVDDPDSQFEEESDDEMPP